MWTGGRHRRQFTIKCNDSQAERRRLAAVQCGSWPSTCHQPPRSQLVSTDSCANTKAACTSYPHGPKITEGLLNHIEVAVRAFDPCLSCATHAIGKMPLEVQLVDAEGTVVDTLVRNSK